MSRRPLNPLKQPRSAVISPADASAPRPASNSPGAVECTGPASTLSPTTGDHRGSSVDVGADFFSASDLEALALPKLPRQRRHISRLATVEKWPHRDRDGKGGGREFPLVALPPASRAEILRRRLIDDHKKASGHEGRPHAPLQTIASLKSSQAERLAARTALLNAFYAMQGDRSARATLPTFIQAYAEQHVELPDWARPMLPVALSERTMKRWLAAHTKGEDEVLAGRWAGGRRSIFEMSKELVEFVVGVHVKQPVLSGAMIQRLVEEKFPGGVPDASGVLQSHPSQGSIIRFLNGWKADPANRLLFTAVTDPDRYRSKFRVAIGDAFAGIVRPNQRWMIDASPSDVLCLDGRRNLYVVVEVFSRRLLALVTDTPKTTASLLLVARACQAWGMPEELWTDNGSDFKSKHFVMAMRQLGVHHHRTKPYSPELKSFIERAIGTVQHGFMPFLKGYIGHNVASRSKIEARFSFAERMGESTEKLVNAGITSGELQDHISNWISNEYEQTPHGGLGKRTPIDAWHAGWAAVEGEPKFANPLALGGLLMPPARNGIRTVGREGLSVEGIDYVSPHLIVGQKVQVRLDPDDLGTVWVYTDEDPWQFLGIAENLELKGLNRAEAARKARVMQDAFRREGVAYLRDLAKRADMHNVASRMIGEAPLPSPANFDFSHTTPALEEAARAMTTRGRRVIAEPTPEASEKHQRFVETFKADKQIEETPQQRYARWKTLKAEADAGADIPDELKDWFETYPTLPEYRSCEFIDQSFRKNGGE